MRRLLVAGFAALAVVLGLVVTAGVASAAPSADVCVPSLAGVLPVHCPGDRDGRGLRGGLGVHLDAGLDVGGNLNDPQIFCPLGTHRVGDHCAPGPIVGCSGNNVRCGNPGFPWGGPWGGPRTFGHQLWLDQNLSLDTCGYGDYNTFLLRNGVHRDGILRLLGGDPQARWFALHQGCNNGGVSVSNDGQCVTFRTDAQRFGDELNGVRRDWGGLRLRLGQLHQGFNGTNLDLLSLSERNDWLRLRNLDGQRFGDWNRTLGQLRTICNDPNPPVVIVQAPVAYADPAPSGNDAASNPPAAAPLTSPGPVPSGAVQTGGDSAAFVLAHNRAV